MPLEQTQKYRPGFRFLGPHVETIYPYLFRRIEGLTFERERVELPDGDFLDLDWSRVKGNHLLILCHGLEGSSQSQYMKGMTIAAQQRGIDVLCINFRSCSGEMNRRLQLYHHGETSDLSFVIDRILQEDQYRSLSLAGFSLGGNVILKYLGSLADRVHKKIRNAVVVSVPCDLASSSHALDQWYNVLYTRRFMKALKVKFAHKDQQFPGLIRMQEFDNVKTWRQFDNTFTTAVTGFENADVYYKQGSARNYLHGIQIPTLIINALNDPFLMAPSYPYELCRDHRKVYLETPRYGGHVGFWYPRLKEAYTETRAHQFMDQFA